MMQRNTRGLGWGWGWGMTGARRGGAAKGCLIAAGVVVVLIVALVVTVMLTWKKVAGAAMTATTVAVVDASSIPDDQKARIKTRVDSVVKDWKDGKVSGEQLGEVMKQIVESPVFPAAMAGLADKQYLSRSGLTDDEKAAGRRVLQRFARGVFEKKIPEAEADPVIAMMQTKDAAGNDKFKEAMTDDEVKAMLVKAKAAADKAEVPDEEFNVDFAGEIDRAIDRALAPTK